MNRIDAFIQGRCSQLIKNEWACFPEVDGSVTDLCVSVFFSGKMEEL